MTTLPARILAGEVEAPDLFCGGTPCQAFSVAGLRRSLDDARGNLSLTFCEIADAIDHVRLAGGEPASIVFWENVPGVLSTKDNAFGCFLARLCGGDEPLHAPDGWPDAGCVSGPTRTAAWRVLDAQFFGLAQRRRRVFVVASARDDFDPAAVLLEFEGVRRDTPPSRETGESAAPCVTAGAANGGAAHGARSGSAKDNLIVPVGIDFQNAALSGDMAGTLDAEGQRRGNRGHGVLAFGGGQNCAQTDVSTSLSAHPGGSRLDFQTETFVAFTQNSRSEVRQIGGDGQVVGALAADAGAQQQNYIAFPANLSGTQHATTENLAPAMGAKNPTAVAMRESGQGYWMQDDIAGTIDANMGMSGHANRPAVIKHPAMQVRRLTPVECERLQGFPDGYTQIPWRGKPASECPDGPRYKALGNSWAVPCVRWIGRRIHEFMK